MRKIYSRLCTAFALVVLSIFATPVIAQDVGCLWGVPRYYNELGPMCLPDSTSLMSDGNDMRAFFLFPGTNYYFDVGAVAFARQGPLGGGIAYPIPGCGLSGAQPGDSMAVPVGFESDDSFMGLFLSQSDLDLANICVQQINSFGEFCLPGALVPFDRFHNPLAEPDYGPPGQNEELGDPLSLTTHSWQFNRYHTW